MAGTPTKNIIQAARFHLNELKPRFWSDDELLSITRRCYTDLWAGVIDLYQEHYLSVVDEDSDTPVTMDSGASQLSNVPNDTFRVHLIEPSDTSSTGAHRNVAFVPKDYNHPLFMAARAQGTLDPSGDLIIYYTLTGQGSPIAPPVVRVAPKLSTTLTLRFAYVPTLGVSSFTLNSVNPIPGESDNAVIAWIVAFARAKENESNAPDPSWLAVYATEKQSLLTRMTPRQTQEIVVVDSLFSDYWS